MKIYEKHFFVRVWTSIKPRADQGHFGQFSWKMHFRYSDARTGHTISFWMLLRTLGKKNDIFGYFRVRHVNRR